MTKCFLLGAGASYGFKELAHENQRPPLGEYLFVDGWESGLLRQPDFSELLEFVKMFANIEEEVKQGSDLKINAEEFLREMHWNFENLFEHQMEPHVFSVQRALSEAYYYFYELFRKYTNQYNPKKDNYTKLAQHIDAIDGKILSLNYDCMIEKAIRKVNLDYKYSGFPGYFYSGTKHRSQSIPLIKLHGSVNWVSGFDRSMADPENPDFKERIRNIHTNQTNYEQLNVDHLDFRQLRSTTYRHLAFEPDVVYEPVIIPPIDSEKNYEKLDEYEKMWGIAEKYLTNSSELVVIGSKMSANDRKLLELVEDNLEDGSTVTLVSGDSSGKIQTRLSDRFNHLNVETECLRFGEYMDTLNGT